MLSPAAVPPEPTFPEVKKIGFAAPLKWLARGWADIWRQPWVSLAYGLIVALAGTLILTATAQLPYLFTAAITGFMLVAPVLAAGLYELSRRYLREGPVLESVTLAASLHAWQRNPSGLAGFALLSLLAGTAWQVVSVVLVALFYKGGAMAPLAMIGEILRHPQYMPLFLVYIAVGGTLAALVFAASVVTLPMLVERRCSLLCGLVTSISAVAENPLPLALWGIIIMLLTGLGFTTALLGFVVILPWLGHASFHAYRDLVAEEPQ
jgi:uncharacterized membrane protein